jgi:hypothetical protein
MESLCTSRPMNRTGPLLVASGRSSRAAVVAGAAGWGRGERVDFCGSTGLRSRSMYVFVVSVFPFIRCLGRESHNRWLGTVHAVQPTFAPENRHRFHSHRQPYCLGHFRMLPMKPMFKLLAMTLTAASAAMLFGCDRQRTIPDAQSKQPKRVEITGYNDDAMEPFISRDGRYLLFNNLNEATTNTDIHFAEHEDDFTWLYRGKVNGVNTPALEGCPTMDRAGRMFFVSPRKYAQSLCTIYTGIFKEGNVNEVQTVESISRKKPGIVNFDVDVSPDGKTLVFVDSRFKPNVGPQSANLVIAAWDGVQFVRSSDSARLLSQVNKTSALQYAPTISADMLTLFFTRFDRHSRFKGPQIYYATRLATNVPFGQLVHLEGLGEYVEGTALSADERLLYFHRQDGKRYNLYAIPIR